MRILFVNANLFGHINPTLGLVKKLTERKHQVDYFCAAPFAEAVKKMGAEWIGYSDRLEQFLKEYKPTDRHPFFMLMEYMLRYDEAVLPEILELIRGGDYDMIICDSIFGGGCFLRKLTEIPVVMSHSSFALSHAPVPPRMLVKGFHPQLDHCYDILHRICEYYGLEEPTLEEAFICKGVRNIVYTTRTFNADPEIQEPEYLFAGPSLDRLAVVSDFDYSVIGDRKLVYISLGSINTDFMDFYQMCLKAFEEKKYYVMMSIGRKCEISALGQIPANYCVKNFLPQLEILQRADVFVTHAGFNSVNEALYFGVPMLSLPMVNDQSMVAKRLASMQLGLTWDFKTLTADALITCISEILSDSSMKSNCMKMSEEMREHAKLEETVCKLEQVCIFSRKE